MIFINPISIWERNFFTKQMMTTNIINFNKSKYYFIKNNKFIKKRYDIFWEFYMVFVFFFSLIAYSFFQFIIFSKFSNCTHPKAAVNSLNLKFFPILLFGFP